MVNKYNYVETLLKEIFSFHKKTFFVITAIFVISVITGVYVPAFYKYTMISGFSEKASALLSDNLFILSWNIFVNNTFVGFLLIFFCITIFIPAIIIFTNGLLIGAFLNIMHSISYVKGTSFFEPMLASLIPHGILELPAIILTAAIATNMGIKLFFRNHYQPQQSIKSFYKKSIIHFIVIIIPTLFVAAAIETFVTPVVANVFIEETNQEKHKEILEQYIIPIKEITDASKITSTEFVKNEENFDLPFELISYLAFLVDNTNLELLKQAQPKSFIHTFGQYKNNLFTISAAYHQDNTQAQQNADFMQAEFPFEDIQEYLPPKNNYKQHVIVDDTIIIIIRSNTSTRDFNSIVEQQKAWLQDK
jgi:stage II sporulation protein M